MKFHLNAFINSKNCKKRILAIILKDNYFYSTTRGGEMQNRIEVNPDICHGKPVIRGTRIMVRNILGSLAGGETITEIIDNYPELTIEDIEAAVAFAIELVDDTQVSLKMPA